MSDPGDQRPRWLRMLSAGEAITGSTGSALLFVEQLKVHRKLCW